MDSFLSQFHLLRPLWLIALIPAFAFFVLLLKRQLTSARWNGIIDKALMPHVLDQMPTEQARWPVWFILFAWILTSIALAGPTWQQLPQPVQKKEDALVIVLDMSLSMAAQDVSPDRATRARQKVIDILNQRKEGLTALVVYAGDAYTVTPLTDDSDTIINLVPALSPFIMPAMGSRPDKALSLARKLIEDSGLTKANLLLITDGIQTKDIKRIKESLGKSAHQLSVLTLGTEEGAPIAMQGKGFKRDSNGNIVLPKLHLERIKDLASTLGIRWHQMSYDDRDWQYLLDLDSSLNNPSSQDSDQNEAQNNDQITKPIERQFDLWADEGYWLILVIIVIAAFSFRRGWMLSIVFLITIQPQESYADLWTDAWKTKDQQGKALFESAPKEAAEIFEDSDWKASSHYRAKDYQQAADNFTADPDSSDQQQATSHFNRGNALAHAGKLKEAIKAYDQALELDSSLKDAEFNKNLLEQIQDQQEQNQDQDPEDKSSEDKDSEDQDSKKDSEQQDSENQDSEQQDSEQKDSENQDSKDQDSEQQDSEQQESDDSQSDSKNQKESDQEEEAEDSENKESKGEQSEDEQEEKNSEQKEGQPQGEESQGDEPQSGEEINPDELSDEEKQALKQWLNRVPDDPGGLLKRKFLYQYKQREHQDEGEVTW